MVSYTIHAAVYPLFNVETRFLSASIHLDFSLFTTDNCEE